MINTSLHRGLMWRLLPSLVVALIFSAACAYAAGKYAADLAYDQALMATAEDVALGVRFIGERPTFEMSSQSERILRTDVRDNIFFAVRTDNGQFVAGDADLPSAPTVALDNANSVDFTFRRQSVRGLSMHFERDDGLPFTVTVAETLSKRHDMTRSVLAFMLVPFALVLVIAGLIMWFSVRLGLRPLAALEREIRLRSANELKPFDIPEVPNEVQSLVDTLNDLLHRLDVANRAQQMFLADAAHQLRTPLARIQTQVELFAHRDGPNEENEQADLAKLRTTINRAIRLVHQLLALSRAERDIASITNAPIDLQVLVNDAADDWVHRAIAQGIDFGFDLAPAPTIGDRFLLREMFENLVDNALRYAGDGQCITVSTGTDGPRAFFCVDDSGPGIPAEERTRVLERFYRLPDSTGDGSGLGLAIVRQIASLHQATIEIVPSELGGTRIRVSFKAA